MPFNEAKKIVKAKVSPYVKEKKDMLMKIGYQNLLKKFDFHTRKASKYIAHVGGNNKDKQNYLTQIRKSTDKFLEKKGAFKEFAKYSMRIDMRSEKLHEKTKETIKRREQSKFKELSDKGSKLAKEAKFDDAINNMLALHMHLSPFNRTDKSGNIGESYLRLDKQIEEKVTNLKGQKKLYSQLFKNGNVLEMKGAKIYIDGAKGGNVKFADTNKKSIKELKPSDYKTVSWLAILRKFKIGQFELKKGDKKIDIKTDKEVKEGMAHILELKLLKQINYFYSGELVKLAKTPEEKKLLRAALEENLGAMSLYFDRNPDGTVTPTKIYKMLPQPMKVKQLTLMLQGFQRVRMRMVLEGELGEELKKGDEKDPSKVRFLKAEIDFQNGLHLSAYSKFKKYINDNKNSKDPNILKNLKLARSRIRLSSLHVISLAQRYSLACVNEPTGEKSGFHLSEGFRKRVTKKLNKVFSELRKLIQSGKAKDLDEAYSRLKDKPEGGLGVKVGELGAKGRTETMFLKKHYSFVKTMITTVSTLDQSDSQKDKLEKLGNKARKDKYRGGARVLYEESMKRKLLKRRRELMQDPKFREKNREQFLALTASSGQKLQFEKVVGMLADSLEKKYPGMARGAKAVSNKLNAATDFVSDIFSKKVDLSDILDDIKPKKKTSKYEDYAAIFSESSGIMRRAVSEAGGIEKYHALSLAKKKELYESSRIKILLAKHGNNTHSGNVKAYIKEIMASEGEMGSRTNSVAYNYNDAFDPNNEFFNLSDEGWDFVESLVGEVPLMAASAGTGNVAAIAVKQGVKRLATRLAAKQLMKSAAFRLGVRGSAFVADLAVSEVVDRSMRYILRGEKPPMDIAQLLAHSIGTYGSMKYASKGGQKLLNGIAEKGMAGKIASHAISTAAIEAPCMMAVNGLFGQGEGSLLEQYGRALGTMLASKGSMSMLSASTGGAMMRAEQKYDTNDSINNIKDPWKKKLVDEMVSKNEISTDQLSTILQGNLDFKQITKIRSLLNNPKSKQFIVAYHYAELHGKATKELHEQYQERLLDLRMTGLKQAEAEALLKGVNQNAFNPPEVPKEKKQNEAKRWLKDNTDKVKGWLKNPNIKEAFVTYMEKAQGKYSVFLAKYPRLAKIMPKDLTKLKVIPVPILAMNIGLPLDFKSAKELSSIKVEANKKYEGFKKIEVVEVDESKPWKPPKKIKVEKADGTSEIIDANTPLYTITGPEGKKVTISAATAGHIDSLHIKATEPGSNFNFKSFSEFVDALKKKLPKEVFLQDGKVVLSVEMGTHMGKEGISSTRELLKSKQIRKIDIDNAEAVRQKVYDLNATGDQSAKQAFVDKFKANYPDNKIQFQLVRGEVIVPIVNASKQSTKSLFLVFGPDDKGGKTLYTAAPGRNMPRHPNPKQFSDAEGGIKGAAFKDARRAWFDTVMLVENKGKGETKSKPLHHELNILNKLGLKGEASKIGDLDNKSYKSIGDRIEAAKKLILENIHKLPRDERIRVEDELLKKDPEQRETELLDYVRRGCLADGVTLMPDLVNITKDIFKAGLIDFKSADYDPVIARNKLIEAYRKVEQEVKLEDSKIREHLKKLGVGIESNHHLDVDWYNSVFLRALDNYSRPKHEKNPQSDSDYKKVQRKKLMGALSPYLTAAHVGDLIMSYSKDKSSFNLSFKSGKSTDKLSKHIYKKRPKNGFARVPKVSDYKGDIIDSPPSLEKQKLREGLKIINRDEGAPEMQGGVIIDGNFGYDANGKRIRPDDKLIVDHHDSFDKRTYDTATKMVYSHLSNPEAVKLLESPQYRDKNGKLPIMVNHIDTDSILSTWAMLNRGKPASKELRDIVTKVSFCGDFLVGSRVLKYGATARDYEYIFRGYQQAVMTKAVEAKVQAQIKAVEAQIRQSEASVKDIQRSIDERISTSPALLAKKQELELLKKEGKTKDGKVLSGKEKGPLIGKLSKEYNSMLKSEASDLISRQQKVKSQKQALEKQLKNPRKILKKIKSGKADARFIKANLDNETAAVALNHLIDKVEDIIRNPFKYQKFLNAERKVEQAAVEKAKTLYKEGGIEMKPDPQDPDTLMVTTLDGKRIPNLGQIDGEYFFYRKRADFNKKLILKSTEGSYMVAINTQSVAGLKIYDFNTLRDILVKKEAAKIEERIAGVKKELLDKSIDEKKKEALSSDLEALEVLRERNQKGTLWRNRTQMIFNIAESSITKKEFMDIFRQWKTVNDARNNAKDKVGNVLKGKKGKG